MSNNKVKGLLKGLRYVSQIFDNEKEPEMQIGFPTDVKHVAHIGWDGPSVNSRSWMNDFKSPPGLSSASLNLPEDHIIRDNNGRRSARAPNSPAAKETSELPRSLRRQSSSSPSSSLTIDSFTESPNKEKSVKPKQSSRRSSQNSIKDPPDDAKLNRVTWLPSDSNQAGSVSPAHCLPDIPKKARRKKSKEHSLGNGSKKSSKPQDSSDPETYQSLFSAETYQSPFSDPGPGSHQSISTSKNNELYSQPYEDEAHEKGLNRVN